MGINLFVPKFRTQEILKEIEVCLEKGWTGLGFKTVEFEEKWKEYSGLPCAHFLSSNTAGLHLALNILREERGWKEADEVITTPLTFVSTNHAILYERLTPVFADVDDYLCLDPRSVESRITPRTRAVMFVGMGGNAGQLEAVIGLCRERGLALILDAAHMAGTRLVGEHVGRHVDAAVFSFQAVKNLPTGDSGMICFADPARDRLARKKSWLGISKDTYERFATPDATYRWRYDVESVGFKYHGNSLMAAVALAQLRYLEEDNTRRRELSSLYDSLLPQVPAVTPVRTAPRCVSSRHLYQVCVPRRDDVVEFLHRRGISPGVHYVDNTTYPMYRSGDGTCPVARRKSDTLLSLPLHLNMSDGDARTVVEVLAEAVRALPA